MDTRSITLNCLAHRNSKALIVATLCCVRVWLTTVLRVAPGRVRNSRVCLPMESCVKVRCGGRKALWAVFLRERFLLLMERSFRTFAAQLLLRPNQNCSLTLAIRFAPGFGDEFQQL